MGKVVEKSTSDDFNMARLEWRVTRMWKDESTDDCICGKTGCVHLAEITNKFNGEVLSPIGSSCVEFFWPNEARWMKKGMKTKFRGGDHDKKTFQYVLKTDRSYCEFLRNHTKLKKANFKKFKAWYEEGLMHGYI